MYNNNGTKILNAAKTYGVGSNGSSIYLSPSDLVVYGFAGTATTQRVNLYSTTSTMSAETAANVAKKIYITGLATSYYILSDGGTETSSSPSPGNSGLMIDVGYRAEPFAATTYLRMSNHYNSLCGIVSTNGIPTITFANTTENDIVLNEIDVIAGLWIGTSSFNQMNCIIAGFHFPDITIAPGESYAFTIMHKNG